MQGMSSLKMRGRFHEGRLFVLVNKALCLLKTRAPRRQIDWRLRCSFLAGFVSSFPPLFSIVRITPLRLGHRVDVSLVQWLNIPEVFVKSRNGLDLLDLFTGNL